MSKKIKPLKLPEFINQLIATAKKNREEEVNLSPVEVQRQYEAAYPNLPKKDSSAYRKALQRMNLDKAKRKEVSKELLHNQAQQDIEEYAPVKAYRLIAARDKVQVSQIENQLRNFRKLWELMGKTDPATWTELDVMEAVNAAYPMVEAANGTLEYKAPSAVKALLSPLSTMYKGILSPNWSASLCRHKAGELKDFFSFYELDCFLANLTDSEAMSYEGWQAMFRAHVNMGCREGTNGNTGIVSLLWEDIDFQAKRCSLREKGHRGNAGERWNNVPLDLFPYLEGWKWLMAFWQQQGRPTKGKVFPVNYAQYNDKFHQTRKATGLTRIASDSPTMRLHIFRRTHGQYCRRLGIPLEFICGDAPNGRYGIGWKDPKIPLRYYLTLESEYLDPREIEFMTNRPAYHPTLKAMQEQSQKQKQWLGVTA